MIEVDVKEFEIEKTWEAMIGLGPIATATQLSSLSLLTAAVVWTFGVDSSHEVEVPIVSVTISARVAAELAVVLGAASYFLVNIFNSYRLLLERKLQELIRVSAPEFKLDWNCKYPGVTTYLANVRGRSRTASVVSLVLFGGTLLVPVGFLILLLVHGSRWWRDFSYWLLAIPAVFLVALGLSVFASSELTPASEK